MEKFEGRVIYLLELYTYQMVCTQGLERGNLHGHLKEQLDEEQCCPAEYYL